MQSSNKTIAVNTLILYARMLFSMGISLYTTRVFLNILGVEDYGIYNVVGGFVAMFGLLSGSLSAAISRFITFELGTGNIDKLKRIFSSSVTILAALSLVIIILIEIVGVWFLNEKMSISQDRLYAANWVLQISALTFAINLVSTPYNAAIIAHEKMKAFAYFSIIESIVKLAICYLLIIAPFDKLITYAILLATLAIVLRMAYGWYCKNNFEECSYSFFLDKGILTKIFTFAGWNMFGAGSGILRDQGVNVLINLYYGTTVNSARGIAMQVNTAIFQLVNNFLTAINPQITKNYASNNMQYTIYLVFTGAKVTMFLLFLTSLPIIFETQYVLELWLEEVPQYTVLFVRLILIYTMVEAISYSMVTLMLATGNIKKYQIIVGGCQLLNFPISWFVLYLGGSPESTVIVSIIIGTICMFTRLYMLKEMVDFPALEFLKKIYIRMLCVLLISLPFPLIVQQGVEYGSLRFLIVSIVCCVSTIISILYIGCNSEERAIIVKKCISFVKTKFNHEN